MNPSHPPAPSAAPSPEARAAQLWNTGAKEAALELLERALVAHPDQVSLLLSAARAGLGLLKFRKADALIESALKCTGSSPEVRFQAARLLTQMGARHEKALQILAPTLDPKTPPLPDEATLTIELLDRAGREEEALFLAGRWLEGMGGAAAASLMVQECRLMARRGDKEKALAKLRAIKPASFTAGDPHGPIRLAYEIARLEDALSRPDQGWGQLRQAHLLYRRSLPPFLGRQVGAVAEQLKSVARVLSGRQFGGIVPAEDTSGTRVVLLAGFPRSGTTLMQRHLVDSIPSLRVCDERPCMETTLRGERLPPVLPDGLSAARRGEIGRRYLRCVEEVTGTPPGALLLDKLPGAAHLIPAYAATIRDFRVIWPVRDPRDVLMSGLFLYLPPNASTPAFLDPEALALQIIATYDCWRTIRDLLPIPWLECRYESLVRQTESEVARLHAFAVDGLAIAPAEERNSSSRQALSPSYAEARRQVHDGSIGRWRTYSKPLKKALKRLEPLVKTLGYECEG